MPTVRENRGVDALNFQRFSNVSQAVTERVVPWC